MDWMTFRRNVRKSLSRAENEFASDLVLHGCLDAGWTVRNTVQRLKKAFAESGHDENERCPYCGQHCDDNCDEAQMQDD